MGPRAFERVPSLPTSTIKNDALTSPLRLAGHLLLTASHADLIACPASPAHSSLKNDSETSLTKVPDATVRPTNPPAGGRQRCQTAASAAEERVISEAPRPVTSGEHSTGAATFLRFPSTPSSRPLRGLNVAHLAGRFADGRPCPWRGLRDMSTPPSPQLAGRAACDGEQTFELPRLPAVSCRAASRGGSRLPGPSRRGWRGSRRAR